MAKISGIAVVLVALVIAQAVAAEVPLRGTIDGSMRKSTPQPRFAWPLCSELLASFGYHVDPIGGHVQFHPGIDIKGEFGADVRASRGGVVRAAEMRGPDGLTVEIDHGDGLVTRYAHLKIAFVRAGNAIEQGVLIARVGSSGRSNGPHLHFEVLQGNAPQDPLRQLAETANCRRMSADEAYRKTHRDALDEGKTR